MELVSPIMSPDENDVHRCIGEGDNILFAFLLKTHHFFFLNFFIYFFFNFTEI